MNAEVSARLTDAQPTVTEEYPCAARKPGRPRQEGVDQAIVLATLELFVEDGYHALTVEAVAAKAGVSKATIYRRWQGKRDLVVDALATLNDDLPVITEGSTADRVLVVLRHMCTKDGSSLPGRIMPRMLVYRVSQPDLYAEYFTRVVLPRRQILHAVLQYGIDQGELRPDLDVELAALALIGPVMIRMHGQGELPLDSNMPEQLLDLLWPGIKAAVN
jgi:AcrR family transcriptional regulator